MGEMAIWEVQRIINKKFWEDLWYDTDRTESDASNNSIILCIRCSGNVLTEPLPSNGDLASLQGEAW
jgi:hypothetical protein